MPLKPNNKITPLPEEISEADASWEKTSHLKGLPRRAIKGAVDLERQLILRLNPKRWPTFGQLRHSYKIFSRTEKKIIMGCFALMITSVAWLGIARANEFLVTKPASGGSYTEAIIGQPKFINPAYSSVSAVDSDLTRLIYSGLLRYDKELNLAPDLAESFSAGADDLTFTIRLKPNLKWHDNEPLTMDDVMFTFESIKSKDVQSPLAPMFSGAVIERVNDETVRFTLPDPYPAFPHSLTVGIIPKHLWSSIPGAQWRGTELNFRPVGSGAWQFDTISREKDGYVKYIKFSRAQTQAGRSAPYLERLVLKFYPDDTSAMTAIHSQEADGLALVYPTADLQRQTGRYINQYDLSFPALTAIFFNLNNDSAIGEQEVRRALNESIDLQDLIVNELNGRAAMSAGPIPNRHSVNGRSSQDGPDQILENAGWKKIGSIRRNKKDEILSVTLSIIDRMPDRHVGEFVAAQWQRLGVDVKLDLVSPPTPTTIERRLLGPRSYQALLFTIVYGAAIDPYPFWHSAERIDPGLNLSMYANAKVDSAIEQFRRTTNEASREVALKIIEENIKNDVPAVFLYSPLRTYLINENVFGVQVKRLATPADRFNNIEEWYTGKTRTIEW